MANKIEAIPGLRLDSESTLEIDAKMLDEYQEFMESYDDWAFKKTVTQDEIVELVNQFYKSNKMTPPKEVIFKDSFWDAGEYARNKWGSYELVNPSISGNVDVDLISRIKFLRSKGKLEKKYEDLADLAVRIGPSFLFDELVVISPPAKAVHYSKSNPTRFSNHNGPAFDYGHEYTDVYMVEGVEVPDWLVKTPADQLDIAKLDEITNAQVRTIFVQKVGMQRLYSKFKFDTIEEVSIVDGSGTSHDYDLLSTSVVAGSVRKYLKMINPSTKEFHVEPVAPEVNTVLEALAWRKGVPVKEYKFPYKLT